MERKTFRAAALGATALVAGMAMWSLAASADDVTLTIESWRNDDLPIWQDKIIPAFEKANPGIKVVFSPTAPTEYNAALNSKLDAGTAGDLITCRPFDASLELFKKGHLAPVTDLPGMENFGSVARSGWSTDDGKTTFCVPMASVIHGFIYNKDAFEKLGISVPKTEDEFFAALDKIKADGTYTPLALGTKDQWEAATMGYQNIGPNYWHGEDGRLALIAGKEKLTDKEWVASPDFATIYANSLPGFFSLSDQPVKLEDPIATEFVSWRKDCKTTIRSTYQVLSRGTPNLENETWAASANVINGSETPEQAGERLQKGLDSWYKPAQ